MTIIRLNFWQMCTADVKERLCVYLIHEDRKMQIGDL